MSEFWNVEPIPPEHREKPKVAMLLNNVDISAMSSRRAGEKEYFLISGHNTETNAQHSYYAAYLLGKEGTKLTNGEIKAYVESQKSLTVMVYSLPEQENKDQADQNRRGEVAYYGQFVE